MSKGQRKQPFIFKILPPLILTVLLSFTWQNLAKMMLVSEGYQWFQNYWQHTYFAYYTLEHNEILSAVLGRIFSTYYGLNMGLYAWSMFVIILTLAILIYLTILTVTKNKLIALAAALISISNYFGFFSILTSQYTYFIDRVVALLFMFPSFLFLHLFLEKKRAKFLFFSLVLYVLGLYLARWEMLLTGLYCSYPFFWWVFKDRRNLKTASLYFGVIVIFLGISLFFATHSIRRGNTSYSGTEYLFNPQTYRYPEKIVRQIVYWTQYPSILDGVKIKPSGKNKFYYNHEPMAYFDYKKADALTLPIMAAYLLGAAFIFIKLPQQRAFLSTVIFTGLSTLFINAFLGVYVIDTQAGTHRYLNLPTYFLAIFWALFLGALFWNSKKRSPKLVISGLFILLCIYLINSWIISRHFVWYFHNLTPIYKTTSFILENGPKYKTGTLVVTPYELIDFWATIFLNDQFKKQGLRFNPDQERNFDDSDWRKIASSSASVVRLHYDKKCQCVTEEKIK